MYARRIAIVGLLLAFAPLTGCLYPATARIDFEEQAACDGVRDVLIETRNGVIELRGEPGRKQVEYRGAKFARGADAADAQAAADQIEIVAERPTDRPDRLRIAAEVPVHLHDRSPGANFIVAAPAGANFDLRTRNGRVQVERIDGVVRVDTSNGHVTASDLRGDAELETSNGSIIARNVGGDLAARTSNGNIRLQSVGANRVRAVTSNGNIVADQVRGSALTRSSNGSIELRIAALPANAQVEAVSSNGGVYVEAPEDVAARLRMQTSNGRVNTDLQNARVTDIRTSRSSLSATLNGGGGSIEISSSNGSVTLNTRPAAGIRPSDPSQSATQATMIR